MSWVSSRARLTELKYSKNVGAGLLAKAVVQLIPVLIDTSHSLASPLPQLIFTGFQKSVGVGVPHPIPHAWQMHLFTHLLDRTRQRRAL